MLRKLAVLANSNRLWIFRSQLRRLFSGKKDWYGIFFIILEIFDEYVPAERVYLFQAVCVYENPWTTSAASLNVVEKLTRRIPVKIAHQFHVNIPAISMNKNLEIRSHYPSSVSAKTIRFQILGAKRLQLISVTGLYVSPVLLSREQKAGMAFSH